MLRYLPAPAGRETIYLKQTESGTCTLTAAAMLLRSAAAGARHDYAALTPETLRPVAWCTAGLRFSFTCGGYTVAHSAFPSEAGPAIARTLLRQHPEGLLLYNETVPHGVFLTDYSETDGRFYAADPSRRAPEGRILLTDTVLPGDSDEAVLRGVSAYWYVAEAPKTETALTTAAATTVPEETADGDTPSSAEQLRQTS